MKRFYSNILIIAILIGSLIICSDGFAGQTYFDPVSGRMNSLPTSANFPAGVTVGATGSITEETNTMTLDDGDGSPVTLQDIRTAVSGGDAAAIHDDTAGEIHAITEKASPVSADEIIIEDSAASYAKKRVQIGNLPGGGTDDQTAAEVSYTPTGNIEATDAQAAINELDTEKSGTGHDHSGVYEPVDATIIKQADVDDTPVNGVTTAPASSNWAYDHENAANPHSGSQATLTNPVVSDDTTTVENQIPQFTDTNNQLKDSLGLVTTVGDPGADTNLPTEQGVREAIAAAVGAPTNVTLTDTADADASFYPVLGGGATGSQATYTDNEFTINANTGILTSTGGFAGALNGTVGATTPAAGAFTTLATTSTVTVGSGSNGVLLTSDGDGALIITGDSEGYDESLTFNLDDVENEVGVTSASGVTKIDFGTIGIAAGTVTASTGFVLGDTDYIGIPSNEIITFNAAGTIVASGAVFISTGGIKVPDPVIGDPDSWSPAAADYLSGRLIASAAGTFALPALASGMGFSLSVDTGISVTADRNGSDTMTLTYLLDGTLTQTASITSIDITGPELCVFAFRSAGVWEVQCGDNTVDGS